MALVRKLCQTGGVRIPEASIVQVITQASPHMHEAQYITGKVNGLIKDQPSVAQYIMAHQGELSVDGMVTVLFCAALIQDSVAVASGRQPARLSFAQLDAAAQAAPTLEELAQVEPDLASFIASNVDLAQGEAAALVARRVLAHVARALVG